MGVLDSVSYLTSFPTISSDLRNILLCFESLKIISFHFSVFYLSDRENPDNPSP